MIVMGKTLDLNRSPPRRIPEFEICFINAAHRVILPIDAHVGIYPDNIFHAQVGGLQDHSHVIECLLDLTAKIPRCFARKRIHSPLG